MDDSSSHEPQAVTVSHFLPQPPPISQAVVDYVVQFMDVDNPLGLKELSTKKICQLWKVHVVNGDIVEVVGLISTSVVDERYMFN